MKDHPIIMVLVEAKLNLFFSEKIEKPDLTGLIIGIRNVQTLHLGGGSVDVISRCVEDGLVLPVFKNLVKLSFATGNKEGWKLLPYLLKQSPKVETLTVQGNDGDTCDVTIGLLQVKVLDVLGYKGTAKEFEHLKSLLVCIECIEKNATGVPGRCLVVDDDTITQTPWDLVTLLGVVAAEVAYFK